MNTLTLTENATLTGGVWSGTIGLSAPSATLFPGHSFSAAITSNVAGQDALTGTFTIGATTGTDFALTIPSTANLVMNIGEALSITASNVNFSYASTGGDSQTLATLQTATVTSPQFTSMPSATLSNFALREDGFSFDTFTLSSAPSSSPSIGNFITTTGVTLKASNFDASFGTSANPTPTLTGLVGITVSGLELFPTGNFVQLQTTGVTASYNFGNFDGTDPTGQLSVTISGFQLTMGQALQISADSSDVVITPDQQTLATIGTVTLSSPLLTSLGMVTASNLHIDQTGFSLGSLNWTSPGAVTIGPDILSFGSVEVDVNNFALQYGATPSVSGTISFAANDATLFPDVSVLNVSLGSLTGSFDFGNAASPGLMNVQISNLNIALGEAVTINLGSVDLTPGQNTILSASDVSVTANLFSGLPAFTLPTFTLTRTGFSLGNFTIQAASGIDIGNFLALSNVSIGVNDFEVDTQANPEISGSITATIGGMTLFPGNTAVTSSFTNIQASYDFGSTTHPGQFSLMVDSLSLSLFGQISLAASNITITPDQTTLATIGSATLTFAPLDNLGMTVTDLAIQKTGFTIASASVNLPSDLTLGNLLTLTSPTVTLSNVAYTFGGNLSGTVDFSTTGASLQLGAALEASVGQSSGSYNLATHALSMTLDNFSLSLAGFANLTAAGISLSYEPATDGSSQITVGATGVEAFLGTGTGSNRVGVDLTNGTLGLAVFDSTSHVITYALNATGTVNLLGLPANSISVTSGNVQFLADTAGALSTTVTVGSTSVPLDFTANETEILAQGLNISVGGFASITGDFGFQEFTTNSHTYLAIGAENVTATVLAGGVSVAAIGASLGLLIDTTRTTPSYALVAEGGTDSLTGVPGLTLTGTGLKVRVRNGLDPSTVSLPSGGVVTPDGTVNLDFSNLGSGTSNVTDVEGHVTLAIANFVSITGDFGFQKFSDGNSTYLAVGATGLTIVLGTSTTNLTLTNGSFGLVIAPGTGYALEATAGSTALNGVPDLTLNASNLLVLVRNGLDVSGDSNIPSSILTPGGAVTLDFSGLGTGTTNVTDIEGSVTLSVANLGTLSGDFGFQSYVDQSGAQQIAVGATHLTATIGTTSTNLMLSGASVGLVIEPGTGSNPTTYALEATGGTASLNGVPGLTLSADHLLVEARKGLDLSAVKGLPVIHTSGGDVTLDFSGLGTGTGDVFAVQGVVTLSVVNFVSLTGAFDLQVNTNGTHTYLAAGMEGDVTLTAGPVSLDLTNLTIGVLVDDNNGTTSYALQATEGNGSQTTFNGPAGLSLSASNLAVLVDRGLDVSTYPSGVPTSVSVPAITQNTTEAYSPDWTTTTSITLQHTASTGTLVVTSTPSGGGTPVTLVAGTDYSLGTDTNGNTTITFLHVPAVGSTIHASYSYVTQPAATISLNFGDLPAGTTNVTDIQGSVSLSVAGFVSLQGSFGFQEYTPATGDPILVVGATNVNAVLGTATTNLTITGASLGVMIQDGNYALQANGGTVALNGVPDLSFAASSLEVKVEHGLDPANVSGAPTSIATPGGNVALDFSGLTGTDVTQVEGTATISVANFVSLSGTYSFTESTVQDADGKGTTTKILVGASDVNAFIGTEDSLGNPVVGVQIIGASLGLVIYRDTEATASTYALQASAPSISVVGLPAGISLTGSASVAINTTGAAVNEPIPGTSQTVSFADGTDIESFGGSLTLGIAGAFSLSGDFSFTKVVDGNITKLLVGAANIIAPSIAADGGAGSFSVSNGTLGLVFYTDDSTHQSLGYAMTASATAQATAGGSSASVTLTILRNTTTTAENDTVLVGAASIPVVFTSSQVEVGTTAYQSIAVSNASLNIDNGLIITATSGTSTTPVAGASSENITGVTLTLQNPSNSQVLFTVNAGSAAFTTFSSTVSASNATSHGLSARHDGQSWQNGDEDLLLTNVSFTIGGFVSFTAGSIDVQHYTSNGATVDVFIFDNATVALLSNGKPMVTLMGNPTFDYVTGASNPADNGFSLDPSSTPFTGFKFLDPTTTLGPITLVNPSVGLHDFSFAMSGTLSATVDISAQTATIGSSPVSATFTNLTGSFDLGLTFNLGNLSQLPTVSANGFSITASSITVDLGPYVTLSATGTQANPLAINPTAGSNQNLISFGTLSATLNIPGTPVNITGSASNFAIEGNGSFLAESGFGVSLSLGQNDSSNLSWPSWLPLQSASASLIWPNFNTDPNDFVIDLSATIQTTIVGMTLSGSATDVVIDPTLIASGQFGITSIGGFAVSISGNLFGGSVSGTVIAGVVTFDSNGKVVDGLDNLVGTTKPGVAPFTHAFYAGIEGGFNIGDMAGFNIRVGLSQFGPLQIYVEADVPIPLGDTGLFLSDFRGGITFNTTFPTINISNPPKASDALQLGGTAFSTPDSLTAAQWQAQLQQQVANQYHSGQTGSFSFPSSGNFIIQAGMTLYDVSPDVFAISGDVFFDTTGNFLVIGTATVADSFSEGVKVYANLAPLFAGQQSLNILFLVQVPAQPNAEGLLPIYQIYGFVKFTDINNVFKITIAGEADLNVFNGLKAEVTATMTLTFTANSFNLTLSDGTLSIPTIQSSPLGTADASITIENDNGSVAIWGGFLLTTNLTALNSEGIYTSAQVFVKLNTTDVEHTVTLSNGTLSLDPESFSLFINGVADFQVGNQQIFALDGTLTMDISAESLTIFVQAQLLLGPDSTHPIMTFNANGLIDVQMVEDDSNANNPIHPGLAAKMTLTLGAGVPNGITFGENWLMVLNTTESTVTFTIPQPVATNPPSPPIPTVLGPDYSSSNPLALTSYETITNTGARTLVIPDGAPLTGLSNYSNWTPASPNIYFLVLGRGTVTVANSFTLSGNINIDADVSSSSVSFTLDVNANLAVQLNGNTVFSFAVDGGLQLSNAGVAAVLDLNVSSGVPSNLGFALNASFMLELNTTQNAVTLAGISLPAGQAMIAASGDMKFLGGVVDLSGTFDFTVNSSSLTVAVTSHVTFLGATFTADGFAGIYYDSHPGLALNISLALPGGAQGIAPIAALGSNFVISGAFDLELNTCSVARTDPITNASIDPGFQVAVSHLGVYLFGFNATGSISIGITNSGFNFTVALDLNFFDIVHIDISGYYYGPNNFSFTGSAGFQLGDHTFGIGGSLSITISSNGFAASVSGWAAAFGLQISAFGSVAITGSSVDIEVGFSVTIVPAINIDTPDVNFGLFTIPGIHIHTAAVVITEYADFHIGTISQPPAVASANPPPPTPPSLAGEVTDTNHNNLNALELYIGQDVGNRKNSAGQVTGAQTAENYTLTRVAGDPGSTNGETIQVSALGLQQTYDNVQEILVSNTQTGNDTINISSGIVDPVYMTLGSGKNIINTGGGPATVTVAGDGSNQISSGNNAVITLSGNGSNQVTAGADSTVNVSGNGNNVISLNSSSSDPTNVTITGTGANHVTDTGGTPTITVAGTATGSNSILVNTGSVSTFNIHGGGNNAITALGSGPATVTVDGNGGNQITTGGTAGGALSNVYLKGSGNNQVSTGAGPANVYDEGTGGNTVSGGTGGGIDYYGVNGSGAAYASKGSSSLSTAYHNFSASVSGYSTYQLSDYNLLAGNYALGLSGVRSVTLSAASSSAANSFTLANWSGNATLNGAGSNNTFTSVPGPTVGGVNDVLSNSSLQVTGGVTQTISLSDIQTANLVGSSNGASSFDVSSWTGNGSLTGRPGTTNTLSATNDVANFILSDTLLQRTAHRDMALSGIQVANLNGGPSANAFTVSSWSGTANLNGGEGSDTYNLTLSGSGTGTVNVADSGSTGIDTLKVTALKTTFVTSTSVKVGTQGVNYGTSGIEVLNVIGGTDSLTFNVQSTSSGVNATTVQTVGSSNVINVSSDAGTNNGNLAGIKGTLTVQGGSGSGNRLNVSDTGDSTASTTSTLSSTALTSTAFGTGGSLSYSSLATLNVSMGGGGNSFTVANTASGTTTTVNSGTGNDTVNVQGALSSLTINAQAGNDTINVSSTSGTLSGIAGLVTINGGGQSGDALNVSDTSDTTPSTSTLTGTTLASTAFGSGGSIAYGTLATLNVSMGSGGNSFTVANTASGTTTTVNSGTSSDTVNVQGALSSLTINAQAGNDTINVSSTSGTLSGIAGLVTINGGGQSGDALNVSDTSDTTPSTSTLTGTTLASTAFGSGGSIAYGTLATLNVSMGNGGTTGNTFNIAVASGQDLPATTTINGGSSNHDSLVANWAKDFNGTLNLLGFEFATIAIGNNFNGTLFDSGPIQKLTIGGALGAAATLHVGGDLTEMTLGPDMFSPGHDMAGTLIVDGTLGDLRVAGGTPGNITAGHVGTIRTYGGYGPYVLQIKENGIQRRVEAAVPSSPYPVLNSPPVPTAASPASVTFQYYYESGSLANPQLTARVSNSSPAVDQYDLSLVTYNDTAKFNLARLDAADKSGIRNVDVEGDVLTAVSSQASSFFPGDNTAAGIRLPQDNLAGVGVRDFIPNSSIKAVSIQAVAFGSHATGTGQMVTGAASLGTDAQALLASGTAMVYTNDTYRVPFADLPTQQVQLFLVTNPSGGSFNNNGILLTVQGVTSPNGAGTVNLVTLSNVARGAATALVKMVPTYDSRGNLLSPVVQSIDLRGDGGSIQTQQPFSATASITSTGPLGDLTVSSAQGINNVTAPSMFGSLTTPGPITGLVQTTGQRTDPITGVVSTVSADLGELYVNTSGKTSVVTSTTVQTGGLSGKLISRGDLISQVTLNLGPLTGVLAAQGNLGKIFTPTPTSGPATRLGGVLINNPFSGELVVLGQILGDMRFNGGLKGGRIAAKGKGGIVGNLTINGGLDANSAVVSGGEIGDTTLGTQFTFNGNNKGILAAKGPMNFAKGSPGGYVFNPATGPNAAAIDAIFTTNNGSALGFDLSGLDLGGLNLILTDLAALQVDSAGKLTGPNP